MSTPAVVSGACAPAAICTLPALHCQGTALPHPRSRLPSPQVFTLQDLGMQPALLQAFADHAGALPWDPYDVARQRRAMLYRHHSILRPQARERLAQWDGSEADPAWPALLDLLPSMLRAALLRVAPHRRRALRKYLMQRVTTASWIAQALDDPHFEQPATGGRAPRRTFALLPAALACHPDMLRLLAGVAETVYQRCGAQRLAVSAHQMLTVAAAHGTAQPAPEGIHQDGADYIVSALVLRRRNVGGGVSRVYRGRGGRLLLSRTLEEGQGLFQPDAGSPLWHEVTAIHSEDDAPGERMILGLDVNVLADGAP